MPTAFAAAERTDSKGLLEEINAVDHHPVVDTLLLAVGGLLAVLNDKRQVLALNDRLLQRLGLPDSAAVLGLRLGEALSCAHAHDGPGGCATGEFCRTCGAAVAQVIAQASGQPVERVCSIDTQRDGNTGHLFFSIRAVPFLLGSRRLLLVLMVDISQQQRVAMLERAFFHDLNNTLTCLLGASAELAGSAEGEAAEAARGVERLAERLTREIQLQQSLAASRSREIAARRSRISVGRLLADLHESVASHPAAADRRYEAINPVPDLQITTDSLLLLRVLGNMLINALEATEAGGAVRLRVTLAGKSIEFRVWNRAVIPPDTARRVFQQDFSTKGTVGRGMGTYSMRLLGEQVLGGEVGFSTAEATGTEFWVRLPV